MVETSMLKCSPGQGLCDCEDVREITRIEALNREGVVHFRDVLPLFIIQFYNSLMFHNMLPKLKSSCLKRGSLENDYLCIGLQLIRNSFLKNTQRQ